MSCNTHQWLPLYAHDATHHTSFGVRQLSSDSADLQLNYKSLLERSNSLDCCCMQGNLVRAALLCEIASSLDLPTDLLAVVCIERRDAQCCSTFNDLLLFFINLPCRRCWLTLLTTVSC